jgi:diacylglycerol O-acyltransferase / wax synthase
MSAGAVPGVPPVEGGAEIFGSRRMEFLACCPILRSMPERVSAIDGSFLRVETANAHMHVVWSAQFRLTAGRPRPSLNRLRRHIAGRLEQVPRLRRRLAYPLPGMGEPYWVDDPDFDPSGHVLELGMPNTELDDRRFNFLCDRVLSEPLPRDRPLWEIRLAPRIRGDRCGIVARSTRPGGRQVRPRGGAAPLRHGPRCGDRAAGSLGAGAPARTRAACGRSPGGRGRGVASGGTGRGSHGGRAALDRRPAAWHAASGCAGHGEDLLRPAPDSALNARIGPRRTLVRHSAPVGDFLAVKRRMGVTLNDVVLAVATGALRDLALARGERPRPLKARVPVNLGARETSKARAHRALAVPSQAASLGNRISLAFVDLPLDVGSPERRLARLHTATAAFKRGGKPAGAEAVFGALGLLSDALRGVAARAVSSPRVYNLTISNVPGPRVPLYLLGAE